MSFSSQLAIRQPSLDAGCAMHYRLPMTLGKRLKQARLERRMTQQQVADTASEIGGLELTQQAYQKLEGRGSESSVYLFAMAKALRVNAEWLQTGQGASGLEPRGARDEEILQFICRSWQYADNIGRQLLEDAANFVSRGRREGTPAAKPHKIGRGITIARLPNARSRAKRNS